MQCSTMQYSQEISFAESAIAAVLSGMYLSSCPSISFCLEDLALPAFSRGVLTCPTLPCPTQVRWYDLRYTITASGPGMTCSDTHFCPLSVRCCFCSCVC